MGTITSEQLADLAEGRLPPAEAADLRQRLDTDPTARARLTQLEALIGLMRTDTSVDAPEHVINRAVRLMRRPAALERPGLLQRIVAALQSDSRRLALSTGLRAGPSGSHSLTYTAEPWTIDLQLTPRGERWQLRGQLLGPPATGSIVLSGTGEPLNAALDEFGEFSVPSVPAGAYTLMIRTADHEIVLEELELRSS